MAFVCGGGGSKINLVYIELVLIFETTLISYRYDRICHSHKTGSAVSLSKFCKTSGKDLYHPVWFRHHHWSPVVVHQDGVAH